MSRRARREFQLASGETVQYARGEAVVRINGFAQTTPVIFGDDAAAPLIGVFTLEQLERLAVDPVAGALIPATGSLILSPTAVKLRL